MAIAVNQNLCVGCGQCVLFCPEEALIALWGICEIDNNKCIDCLVCVSHCPNDALKEAE